MSYFPGGRNCGTPELAAGFNRRALTEDDLTQMVDDAANFAGQSARSAEHAEEVVAGIDSSVAAASDAAAIAIDAAAEAIGAQGAAADSELRASDDANRAEGAKTAAEVAAASVQKGQPNGTAPLDSNSKLPEANVPTRLSPEGLSSTFVAFQKEDGTPLNAKKVIITVTNDGANISDIKVVN